MPNWYGIIALLLACILELPPYHIVLVDLENLHIKDTYFGPILIL